MAKGIQAEIKQKKAFSSPQEEAFIALVRTADNLQGRTAEMLKPHGLSLSQYNTLRILRGAGATGLACGEIGQRMISRDPDITRLLDRLERRGLIERSREQNDRRVITARIKRAGLNLLKGLDREVAEFHRQLLKHLGKQQLASLLLLLEAVRKGG